MGRWVVEGHAEPGTMMSFVKACFTAGFCASPQRKSFTPENGCRGESSSWLVISMALPSRASHMFTPSQGMFVDMLSLSKFRPKESLKMELIVQDEIEAIA